MRLHLGKNGLETQFADFDTLMVAVRELHAPGDEKNNTIYFGSKTPLREALSALSSRVFSGLVEVESEIKAPLYKGRKWDLRAVVASPSGEPKILGHYAKVGKANSIVSNIAQGGIGTEAARVIHEICRQRHPRAPPARLAKMVEEFFRKINEQTIELTRAATVKLRERFARRVKGFPLEKNICKPGGS